MLEAFQFTLSMSLLGARTNVVIEWGVWSRRERDALHDAARRLRAPVELRALSADPDELFRRIERRDLEGRWGARSITRAELDTWSELDEAPTPEEPAGDDPP